MEEKKSPYTNNIIFAVLVILYEALALPIYGVLFRLSSTFESAFDYGGVLLVCIATILLIIGMYSIIKALGLSTHISSDLLSLA